MARPNGYQCCFLDAPPSPYPDTFLDGYEVSERVGNVRYDDPMCAQAIQMSTECLREILGNCGVRMFLSNLDNHTL